jgi:hypothetical protein
MATAARQKESSATAPAPSPPSRGPVTIIADSEIAERAHDLFLGRGGEHGHDVEDWLQAERELRGAPSSTSE